MKSMSLKEQLDLSRLHIKRETLIVYSDRVCKGIELICTAGSSLLGRAGFLVFSRIVLQPREDITLRNIQWPAIYWVPSRVFRKLVSAWYDSKVYLLRNEKRCINQDGTALIAQSQ